MSEPSESKAWPVTVAVLGLLGASVAPVTSWISGQRTLDLDQQKAKATQQLENGKQRHEVRMAYFSKAVDPSFAGRDSALRFIALSWDDEELRSWALEELDRSQGAPVAAVCATQERRCVNSCVRYKVVPMIPMNEPRDSGLMKLVEKWRAECFDDCRGYRERCEHLPASP